MFDKELLTAEIQIVQNMSFADDPKPDTTSPLANFVSWFERRNLVLPNVVLVLCSRS